MLLPCIATTDTIPSIDITDIIASISTSGIIPNIGITYIIPSIASVDIIPVCPMNNCYPAKKLFEEVLTLNREKHHQLLEVKNERNLTNINKHEFIKINEIKQIHSSQVHIWNFYCFDFTGSGLPMH